MPTHDEAVDTLRREAYRDCGTHSCDSCAFSALRDAGGHPCGMNAAFWALGRLGPIRPETEDSY